MWHFTLHSVTAMKVCSDKWDVLSLMRKTLVAFTEENISCLTVFFGIHSCFSKVVHRQTTVAVT